MKSSQWEWTGFIIFSLFIIAVDADNKKRICYVNSLNQNSNNNDLQFNLDKINVNLCTHLIYSFATIHNETIVPSNKVNGVHFGGYLNFTQLKLRNPELKTIISIREEENEFSQFSILLDNIKTRRSLNKNILKFLKDFQFDGIDFLWQYLGSVPGSRYKCDKKHYVKFLKELRKTFKDDANNSFSISIGIPYHIDKLKQYYDVSRLDQYVDWFTVMKYDSVDLLIAGRKNDTIEDDPIDYYLRAGAFRNKIVLGVSTYGLLFTMESSDQINYTDMKLLKDSPFSIFQLAQKVEILSYSDICKNLKNNPKWKLYVEEFGAFKRILAINQNEVIVFKDIRIIREDVENVIDLNLGGLALWTIDQDDFNGVCIDQPYPLLDTVNRVLNEKSGLKDSTQSNTTLGQNIIDNTLLEKFTLEKEITKDRIVCYTTSWSIYRSGPSKFNQGQIDPNLCTHLIYAYARVDNETVQVGIKNADIELGGYSDFIKLRSGNTKLKLLIGLQVPNEEFSKIIVDTERRIKFIDNVFNFLKEYGFDGIDLLWTEPRLEDKQNLVELLTEMRFKFLDEKINGSKQYLISIQIPSSFETSGYDFPKLNSLVDWYNLRSYNYRSPNEITVNHIAPLYAIDEIENNSNVNATVKYYLNGGIERPKLVVGIPTYGVTYTLRNSANTYFGAEAEGPGLTGKYTNSTGFISYFEICEIQLSDSNWQFNRPYPERVGPYIVNDKQWIGYDDEIMIKNKVEYVINMKLGGINFWTIDQDDFSGVCGSGPFFIIQAAKNAFVNKFNNSHNTLTNTSSTTPPPSTSATLNSRNILNAISSTISPTSTSETLNSHNILTTASSTVSPTSTSATLNLEVPSSNITLNLETTSRITILNRADEDIRDRIICYTTNWSVYRTGIGKFAQRLINPNLCSHVIYAYGRIYENNTFLPSDPNSDLTLGGYVELNQLKQINPNFKTLIGVRDYSENRTLFPSIVASKERRQQFIQSIVDFLNKYNFDGIDIQWRNSMPTEKENFVRFVEEIATKFDEEFKKNLRPRFLMSIELPAKREDMNGFIISELNKYVDWFNALTYNYHSVSENEVNHASSLYPLPEMPLDELNVDFTIREYFNSGADRNKLVITIPTYGHLFSLADIAQTNFGSPALDREIEGMLTRTRGRLAFYEICEFLFKDVDWEIFQPYPKIVGPYIVKGNQWISYDDENMIKIKTDYVADNGLGGVAFWSVDQDDFRGNCGSEPYILIKAAKDRLEAKLGISNLMVTRRPGGIRTTTDTVSTISTSSTFTTTSTITTTTTMTSPTSTSLEIEIVNPGNNFQSSEISNPENTNNRIVCYSTNWSFYRTGTARFVPNEQNINPNLCTHIIYFSAKIENDTIIPLDENVDIISGGYKTLTGLKNKNNNLKTLISIIEQQNNDELLSRFSQITADPVRRSNFVQNVTQFVKKHNFDGIDLVWMYPGGSRGTSNDKKNLIKLLEEFRKTADLDFQFSGRSPFIMTMAVAFETETINNGYDIPGLNKYLDWFNLLTYDYHFSTESQVNHHAPLYPYQGTISLEKNINFTVSNYINLGADRNKIVIGIPTYGRTFTLSDPAQTNYGSPASGSGMPGPFTQLNNSLAYYEICQYINNEGWKIVQNQSSLVGPYAYNNRNWVAFDDENMVSTKADYVALMGLGGMMFWTVDQDDFSGVCTGRANLLISTAKEALYKILSIGGLTSEITKTADIGNIIEGTSTTTVLPFLEVMAQNIINISELILTTTPNPINVNGIMQPITNNLPVSNIENPIDRKDRIVCYSPNWSRYRTQFAKFDSSFIMPDLCTHLIYAFAKIENDKIVPTDTFADIDQKGYEKFNRIKRNNPQLATLISLSTKEEFSELVNDIKKRTSFIENLLVFLKLHDFNGIDIDWQYPGSNPNDKENFVQMLVEMNIKFEVDALALQYSKFLITITIPWQDMYIDSGYDILRLNDLVNWFNLLSYNYHRPNERFVNHHAPLYAIEGVASTEDNVNSTVYNYINAGIQRNKLVVGVPTYGISFTLADENQTNINSPASGPGIKGELSGLEGALTYYEICQKFSSDSDTVWNIRQVDPKVMGPYAFSGTRWVAYDDEEMVRIKANYVADRGLGGLMFWSLDQDDFRGICGDRQPNVLIQTAKRALLEKTSFSSSTSSTASPSLISAVQEFLDRFSTSEPPEILNFKCPDIGLFSNPRDCKTYYGCYGTSESEEGIMPYLLTCPNGAYFDNSIEDCTFLENDQQCGQVNLGIDNREGNRERLVAIGTMTVENSTALKTATTHSPLIKFEKHNFNNNKVVSTTNSSLMSAYDMGMLPNNTFNTKIDHSVEQRDRIVCYSPNWSRYRPQFAKFDSSFIIPDLCTHLIYAFAKIENDKIVPTDTFADIDQKGYEKFNRIKKANPQLLTLISISVKEEFSDIVGDINKRKTFIMNLLKFLKMHDFNGVDIDWQYPGRNSNDKENFVKLLQDINYNFDLDAVEPQNLENYRFLITITIPWQDMYIDRGYDISRLNKLVNWFNLLSYNYHNSNERFVNHHAPLYALEGVAGTENNVNSTVYNYINAGIQRDKLVVGVPTYGISFTLTDENQTNVNSPASGPGIKGELSGLAGSLPYYEICQKISSDNEFAWNIRQVEPRVMGPYAFRETRWVAYDDEEMIRLKAHYVADNGLGGLMFWSLDQDDFRGLCGDRQPNILIQTAKRALLEKISIKVSSNSVGFNTQNTQKDISITTDVPKALDFECSDIGFFPNSRDCKTYYACYGYSDAKEKIKPHLLSCGDGAFFDKSIEDCTFIDSDEQCTNQGERVKSRPSLSATKDTTAFPPNKNINENIGAVDRLLKLIQNFGGIEKLEGFLKQFSFGGNGSRVDTTSFPEILDSSSHKPDPSSTVSDFPVITSKNINKITVSTNIDLVNGPDVVESEFQVKKGKNNEKKISSSSDHIYQIKELHIHNYRESISDNKNLNEALKPNTDLINSAKHPIILFAPVQVINKVES